ncbi:MAG: UvrB domain 3-containing protein, partial [Paraclostridium bifermentans]
YKTCYKIAKNTPDNPSVPVSKATKTVRRYESLHPHNLQQKTAIIIEQFREITKNKIGGRAKSMVVTASRLHAVRYYHEFKRYIERKGYDDVDILVAFSGVVKDGEIEYTESRLNVDKEGHSISDKQLPKKFKNDFNVLVVAEKYQTGFDEPLLHTMFIDKKLSGIKAVQTLSRLNRTYPGKNDTFILDFVNTTEEIQSSFRPYFKETILDEEVNVNLIYKAKLILREFNLYNDEDIERFIKINFKKGKQNNTDLGKMTSLLKPVVNRYNELSDEDKFKFKRTINNFNKWYSYIIQITRMFDKELHKEYSFTNYLSKLLPSNGGIDIDLEGKLRLEFYKLEQTFKGDITLNPKQEPVILSNVKSIDNDGKKEEDEFLDKILKRINERFEGKFDEADRVIVESLYNKCVKGNKKLLKQAKNSDLRMFENNIFPKEFEKIAQSCYMEQMKSFSKLFEDKDFYNSTMESLGKEVYNDLRRKKY